MIEAENKMRGGEVMGNYKKFTKPAEVDKAISTLKGLVKGFSADGIFNEKETHELCNWISIHLDLNNKYPFKELFKIIEAAISEGFMDEENRENLLWFCNNISNRGEYYDEITAAIQELCGLAQGILADKELTDSEIYFLKKWIDETDFLQGCYPFDELTSVLTDILKDGEISEDERNTLAVFLGELVDFKTSYNLSEADYEALKTKYSINGICAMCPEIVFPNKSFVFTGESYRATRDEFYETVRKRGGKPVGSVSSKTDYLVVGNAGNPCWAYSCYGRKIEKAMQLRRQGASVVIVNENDFWDAVMDFDL